MKQIIIRRLVIRSLFSAIAILVMMAGCGSTEFSSTWKTGEIVIDGRNTEWANILTRVEDLPLMVGAVNDSGYLYIMVQTSDRPTIRQILFRGLTVWFDRTGGEEKRFGVRYPLGMQGMGMRMPPRDPEREQGREANPFSRMPLDTTEIEILGPMENDHHRMSVVQLGQISVKFSITDESFVYELRVPLNDDVEPYAIGTTPGSHIGVGLLTGERTERPEGEEQVMPRPEGGQMRGGRRGGMDGPPEGRRMGMQAKPVNFWTRVHLATPLPSEVK